MQNVVIWDFAAGVHLSETQNHIHTEYVYTVYLFTQGKGGGAGWTREKVRGATVQKAGQKYQHDGLYPQSINSDKHLPQRTFTGQYF